MKWFNKKQPPKLILNGAEIVELMNILRVDYDLSLNFNGQVPENYDTATRYPYCDRWGVKIENPELRSVHAMYWKLAEQLQELK